MKIERNYGIDLLRIVLAFFICTLHILGHGGILEASRNTSNYYVFWIFEIISFCAVDGYALISGYIYKDNKNNYKRLILMVMQAFFYSFIITVILRIFNIGEPLNIRSLLNAVFPVITNHFWYVSAYFPLYILMPYINDAINRLDNGDAKKLFAFLVIFFSIIGTIQDNYSNYGESFLWITILFTMGLIIRKVNFLGDVSKRKLIIVGFVSTIITWIVIYIFDSPKISRSISPTILLNAIILLVLFSRLKINSKLVKIVSPLCLGVYLFQENNHIRENFVINRFTFAANINPFLIPFFVLLSTICMFIMGAIVDYIRLSLFKLIHADRIAEYLNNKINCFLEKINRKITVNNEK